ncbi:hypothetical protein DK847_14660 [Aestuariivirga litoralis]|uniref:Uncharacterized protein n=1 Tax=Aestuariivirga litoralis TaxID=2650924 RepID=A0A2W2C872_9HYPH|nr:hypothetical protein [Aestuariivirga litoralis]PZF76413.1 hypothetical protein DK847_14660 [Aestuariivirga litoralis]
MARVRQQQDDRARRLAVALASFCRAQAGLPLQAVAESTECLSLASVLLTLAQTEKPLQRHRKPAGRHPVHDRAFAKAALLDFAVRDPDGMAHQAALIRELERRFEASGHAMPGETWMKQTVREFQAEADTFEMDAAATFAASQTLQGIFGDLGDFLRFRRAKTRASQLWQDNSELRAQFTSPEKLLEAAFHNGSTPTCEAPIRAHSRLAHRRDVMPTANTKRR